MSSKLTRLLGGHLEEANRELHVVQLILDDFHSCPSAIMLGKGVDEPIPLIASMSRLLVREKVVSSEPEQAGQEARRETRAQAKVEIGSISAP